MRVDLALFKKSFYQNDWLIRNKLHIYMKQNRISVIVPI